MSDIERFDMAFYVPPTAPDLPDYLRSLQELGIRHIGTDGFTAWHDPATHERLGETFERFDMQVVSIHSSIGLMWPDLADLDKSLKDNQMIIDLAECWHCPRTVWHMGWFRGGVSDGNWADPTLMESMDVAEIHRRLEPVLRETCARAAEKGVEINLENLPFFRFGRDTREIMQFIRQQELPNLGLILDSGHAWVNNEDPAKLIREAGALLKDTHFHDNLGPQGFDFSTPATPADLGLDMHSIVGLGTINWLEVIRALREIKFAGPVVFEGPRVPEHPDSSVTQWQRCVDLTIRMWRAFEEVATYYEPPGGQQR